MSSGLYNNHPHGSARHSDLKRRHKASRGNWRTSDGVTYPVTVRKVQVCK